MATSIRLKRVGAKGEASYRIVVTDSREGPTGASIERLGTYNPRTRPSQIRIDAARALHWLKEGAEPSDTVRALLKKTGVWKQFNDGVAVEALDEPLVYVGPPADQLGTSARPMPVDRPSATEAEAEAAPKKKPAAKAKKEAPAEEAEAPPAEAVEAEAPEEPEAVEEAAEEAGAADETPEEVVAEADEDGAEADEEAPEADAEEKS